MKELNMKPEEIANLVVLSREKGYAIVIPQDSLYLVSKAFQKQLAHRDAQIAALTADANALRAEGVEWFATALAHEVMKSGEDYDSWKSAASNAAMDYANQLREGK